MKGQRKQIREKKGTNALENPEADLLNTARPGWTAPKCKPMSN